MKKALLVALSLLVLLGTVVAASQEKGKDEPSPRRETVIRTYQLKYVDPHEVEDLISPFVLQQRVDSISKYLVVTVFAENIKAFEELLAKLDVQRPQVIFRIFTLVASQKGGAPALEVPELAGVVADLRRVLGFKSYIMDGVSALTVRSGSFHNLVELNSQINNLNLKLDNVFVDAGEAGQRRVRLGLELYRKEAIGAPGKDQVFVNHRLLMSEQTVIVENGTLVAGVSRLGENGDALVLVIQATIQ